MAQGKLIIRTLGVTAGVMVLAVAGPASAHDGHEAPGTPTGGAAPAAGAPVFLTADLNGGNEVPATAGPKVGDKDGRGHATVRVRGTEICFTVDWDKIDAPTQGHIHAGAAKTNGTVKAGLFAGAIPVPVDTATGCTAADAAVAADIVAHPDQHYVNLHTAAFPGGAVRGQLRTLSKPADLLKPMRGPLVSLMDGGQEIPAAGDADGRGTGFVRARGGQVSFALTWSGIAPPTLGHIHNAGFGAAGALVVPLFAATGGLPPTISGVAGTATADRQLVKKINQDPGDYYLNLHNTEFAAGALRGQLFR
jgi:hypothetical protein